MGLRVALAVLSASALGCGRSEVFFPQSFSTGSGSSSGSSGTTGGISAGSSSSSTTSGSTGSSVVVTAISAGDGLSCALVGGGVQCWGWNGHGQLGNGFTPIDGRSFLPTHVVGLESGVAAIETQGTSPCAIMDGGVQCWGGLSGSASDAGESVPAGVGGLPGNATAIAGGSLENCAVVATGVWCWSSYRDQGLASAQFGGLASSVTDLALGDNGGCAVVQGSAWCWGSDGQWPNGANQVPAQVPGLAGGVSSISISSFGSTCALVNGEVQCWGENLEGQLGDGSDAGSLDPVRVVGLDTDVSAISVGYWHACALVNGKAWCWGDNRSGALGNPDAGLQSSVPVPVVGLASGVSAIAAGTLHTCAIVNDQVWCWGRNLLGELGNPDAGLQSAVPVPVGPWAP